MSKKDKVPANKPVELIESELDDIQGAGDTGPAGGGTLKSTSPLFSSGKTYFTTYATNVKVEGKGVSTISSMTTHNSAPSPAPSPTEETPTEEK